MAQRKKEVVLMVQRKKAPYGFYSAQEAIGEIGITQSAFYALVNAGEIKRIIPPSRKEGFYSKQEIDNYARNQRAFNEPYAVDRLDFGLALAEDLPAVHELTASVSGGTAHAVPKDILKAWIRKNPQSIHILRHKTDIRGYISAFPLEYETLIQRLSGKLLNRSIPIDDIQIFTPNTRTQLYVAEMAVKHNASNLKNNEPNPEQPDLQARLLGARLIREFGRFVSDLSKQGTIITELYAVGTSQFGIAICRDLGMTAMNLPTGVREDRIPFKLDLQQDTASMLVKRLLKA